MKLEPARPFKFAGNGDRMGWHTSEDGLHHLTLFVENGRVADVGEWKLKSALKRIAETADVAFILTPNQNIIIAKADDAARAEIEKIFADPWREAARLGAARSGDRLRGLANLCLALTDAERYLPSLITKLDALLAEHGLNQQPITVRMTGCPNGCARPYIAEIGFVGRNPGRYNLHLGGNADGSRLNRIYKEDADEETILATLAPLFADYAQTRQNGEGFGDFITRRGIV